MTLKKVTIISSGYFPIPATKGGAIESLIDMLIRENERENELDFTIFSMYDNASDELKKNYRRTNVIYIRIPLYIKIMDVIVYHIFKNIIRIKKNMSYRYIFQRLFYIHAVAKHLSKYDFGNLVFENHPTLLSVLKYKNNFNVYNNRYFYHAHNVITNDFGNKKYLLNVKKFICVSEYIEKNIMEYLNVDDISKFSVLKNRIDENKFADIDQLKRNEFLAKYHIPNDKIIFTFSGRLNPEKGAKELLIAFKNANLENAKLIIAGSYYFGLNIRSEYETELRKIAKELNDKIIFTGNIPYDDMPYLYSVSDVIVVPSVWDDPAPLTVIESLTCLKPLITTISGGIPEYANKETSIIIKIDSNFVDNLTKSIIELATNEQKRIKMHENEKAQCLKWTSKKYYEEFVNIFD